MDCGPAALASLLGAFGLPARVDALRDLCGTDVDGTSIDALEELLLAAGLDAEQVVVPLGHALDLDVEHLPALLLTRTPGELVHVVVAWRRRGAFVELMDPAVGRRRVRIDALRHEALRHDFEAGEDEWAQYALSDELQVQLRARLQGQGASAAHAARRVADAVAAGPVAGVGALLTELEGHGPPVVEPTGSVAHDGVPEVAVRGAVLVRVRGVLPGAEVSAALQAALAPAASTPRAEVARLIGAHRRGVTAAVLLSVTTGAGVVLEALAARSVLDAGTGGGRLALLAVAIAGVAAVGTSGAAIALGLGRGFERDLRARLLVATARLGDGYVRTRPVGDFAERAHATLLVRSGVEQAVTALRRAAEVAGVSVAVTVLAPATAPVALALLAGAIAGPVLVARRLQEPDLRARTLSGALAHQLVDDLRGAALIQRLRGQAALTALQTPLIGRWAAAARSMQDRLAAITAGTLVLGFPAAAVAAWLAAGSGARDATALVVAALVLLAAAALQELLVLARRLIPTRNALARLAEPLALAPHDPPPRAAAHRRSGVALRFEDAGVMLSGRRVLDGVSLSVKPGEHVAVVGPSGAGKSTLVAALAGWLDLASGAILVDGRPLAGTALSELRSATAWSSGEVRLWDTGAVANVRYGQADDAPASEARLTSVGWPDGAESDAGEGGSRLDTASAQRLRLARALGRPHPGLVLLDEAFRGLPEDEGRALLASCRASWAHATLLCVTHDLAAARTFARVLVIEDGRVVEDGRPPRSRPTPAAACARCWTPNCGSPIAPRRPWRRRRSHRFQMSARGDRLPSPVVTSSVLRSPRCRQVPPRPVPWSSERASSATAWRAAGTASPDWPAC